MPGAWLIGGKQVETMGSDNESGGPHAFRAAMGTASLPWLARCVGVPTDFLCTSWSKEPLLRQGREGDYADIFGLQSLIRLIDAGDLASDRITLVNRGIGAPPQKYLRLHRSRTGTERTVADPEGVRRLIDNGFTLILSNAHEHVAGLSHICAGLQAELGYRVGANVYYTPPRSHGFKAHTDGHDVIILQVHAEKYWRVFDRRDDDSLEPRNVGVGAEQPPTIETRLRDGDALYIPRRFVHCAAAASRPSLHVTIGIHR